MDKTAYENINQEIQDCYSAINKAHTNLCSKFMEIAKLLKLRDIRIGSESSLDDQNSYYRETFIEEIFDLKNLEIKSYDLDEGFDKLIDFFEELEVSHVLDYVGSITTKEEYILRYPVALQEFKDDFSINFPEEIIDVALECLKTGLKIEDLKYVNRFLIEIVQAPSEALPASWES